MITKMDIFQTFLLDRKDFISCKSFLSLCNDFEHSL